MYIQKKRIRSLARYFSQIDRNRNIYIYSVPNDIENDFSRVGFSDPVPLGTSILPSIVGPVSRFNAEGRESADRNQAKELRVVGQRIWRWTQFGGEEQERVVDIQRLCYPKILTPPPATEMQVMSVDGSLRLVSMIQANSLDETVLHTVNLHLELFGQCFATDDPTNVPIVNPTRVNWRLLPPGAQPWDQARGAAQARISRKSEDTQYIILDRQDFVCSLMPDAVYVGEGGFSDYLAYAFNNKGLVVLESLARGNAIYIFDANWATFSRYTKRDILTNNLHIGRIIHATGWKSELLRALA